MSSLDVELLFIKEKFPQQSARIEELYSSDLDFQSLCSDYLLAVKTLHQLEDDFSMRLSPLKEYQDICKDLETELLLYISE